MAGVVEDRLKGGPGIGPDSTALLSFLLASACLATAILRFSTIRRFIVAGQNSFYL